MYRLLIADDEKVIRETISSLIDWESLGIQVVGVCKNGLEAYDAIIDEYPDIVITDIKMPGLSGVDLVEKLTQTNDRIQFIILSGYGEFEYAKKAMKYGIKHYLLKPCNEQQIISAVQDVLSELQKRRENTVSIEFEKNLFRSLITDGILFHSDQEQFREICGKYPEFSLVSYRLHYFYFLEIENVPVCVSHIQSFAEKYCPWMVCHMIYVKNTLLLIEKKIGDRPLDSEKLLARLSLPSQPVQITHSQEDFPDLQTLYQTLIRKIVRYDTIYYVGAEHMTPIYNYDFCLSRAHQACGRYIELKQDHLQLKEELNSIFRSVQDRNFLIYLITSLLTTQYAHLPGAAFPSVMSFLQKINREDQVQKICDDFFADFETFFPPITAASYKPFIEKLMTYTAEHLSDPHLSLKWLANNYLFMNVDYVSKQFYRQTGEKFSSYLNRLRIDKAKMLLKGLDNQKIYIVAEQVGCGNNPQYFSQLFKKYVGMTPTEYIEKQ